LKKLSVQRDKIGTARYPGDVQERILIFNLFFSGWKAVKIIHSIGSKMEASRRGVIPEDVQTTISTLEKAVSDVEKHIESYLKTSVDEITNDLSTEDGARLSVLLAYALNTLFYSTPQFILSC
jgi:hypothetical protein